MLRKKVELEKPVFIICLHRSGSTLLKNIINKNSKIAMATDEMHLSAPFYKTFDRQYELFGDLKVDENLKKLVDFIYCGNIKGTFWADYRSLGIPKEKVFKALIQTDRSLRNIVTVLLDEYRTIENKDRVGVKYPVHFSRYPMLKNWFPDCKFIYLKRDLRAICASKLNDEATKGRKTKYGPFSAVIHYITLFYFIFEYLWFFSVYQKSKEEKFELFYEELVVNPEATIRHLSQFLEIEFEPSMMKAVGKPSSFSTAQHVGIDKNSINLWEEKLTKIDKLLINGLARRPLKALGYIV